MDTRQRHSVRRQLTAAAVLGFVILVAASGCGGSSLGSEMTPQEAAHYACNNSDQEVLARSIDQADESAGGPGADIAFLLRDLSIADADFDEQCEIFSQITDLAAATRVACETGDPDRVNDLIQASGTDALDASALINTDADQFAEMCERRFDVSAEKGPTPTATAAPAPKPTSVETPRENPTPSSAPNSGGTPSNDDISGLIFAVYEPSDDPLSQAGTVLSLPPLKGEFRDADVRAFATSANATGRVHTTLRFRTSLSFLDAREELQSLLTQVQGPVALDNREPKDQAQRNVYRIEPATFVDNTKGVLAYVLEEHEDGAEINIIIETTNAATLGRIATWPGQAAPFPTFDSLTVASFRSEIVGSRAPQVEYILRTTGTETNREDVGQILADDFAESPFTVTEMDDDSLFDFLFSGPYNGWIDSELRDGELQTSYVATITPSRRPE